MYLSRFYGITFDVSYLNLSRFNNTFFLDQINVLLKIETTKMGCMTSFGHNFHTYEFKIHFRVSRYVGTGAVLRGWPVYWILQKFLTTSHTRSVTVLFIFLSFLSYPTIRNSASFNLRAPKIFLRYRFKKYTCHRRDFGSDVDDFVIKFPFRSMFLWTYSLNITNIYIYVYNISWNVDDIHLNFVFFYCNDLLYISHDNLHLAKKYIICFSKRMLNITDEFTFYPY